MMQGGLPETLTNHVTPRVFGSNNCLIWNEQVLLAIQRMKYNVDACKEVRGCKVEGVRGCEVERERVRKEGEMWRGWGYEAKRVRG